MLRIKAFYEGRVVGFFIIMTDGLDEVLHFTVVRIILAHAMMELESVLTNV